MKPRKPLKRTELNRSTPLRRSEFKRSGRSLQSGGQNASGPVKPRRHPGPKSAEETRCRDLLPIRSGGLCEIGVKVYCIRRASVASHRKRRSQSSKTEKWSPTNVLHGCLPCEWYLTAHGSDPFVRSRGWTVHPSLDPAQVPVSRRGQYVWLSESGDFETCDLSEIAEWIGGAA